MFQIQTLKPPFLAGCSHPQVCQQPGSAAPLCCLGSLLHLEIKDCFRSRDVIIRAQTCATLSIKMYKLINTCADTRRLSQRMSLTGMHCRRKERGGTLCWERKHIFQLMQANLPWHHRNTAHTCVLCCEGENNEKKKKE